MPPPPHTSFPPPQPSPSRGEGVKIALAQINPTVGDIDGNAALIIQHYEKVAQQADLVVFPELCLTGYPPEDLVLTPDFQQKLMQAARTLAENAAHKYPAGAAMIIGSLWAEEGVVYNAALLLDGGKIAHIQPKTMLPNYGIFDEKRLFAAGKGPSAIAWRGITLGVMVCEDIWYPAMAAEYKKQGAELLVVINASPFEAGKLAQRKDVAAQAVREAGVSLVYVNMVGGQDDIVFDGGSFVMSPDGKIVRQLQEFSEDFETVAMQKQNKSWRIAASSQSQPMGMEETLWRAMMMGLRDYVAKNGFSGVVLGISGGIDSAVSAAVAVDALGAERVKGVLLPSPYTSEESVEDALYLAGLLCIQTMTVPITPAMETMQQTLQLPLKPVPNPQSPIPWIEDPSIGGNIQARLRGMILMAISNRFGWMLLSTGNKSELSVGYSTLYGDSCGGYNVLKDVYKTQVYALANWRNAQGEVIPQRSIDKAPSAELAPNQKDEDQLPPYAMLDDILFHHIEQRESAKEIVAKGFDEAIVSKVLRMVRLSEYKRRQSCPGVKLSSMLYGKDRRFPLTNKF